MPELECPRLCVAAHRRGYGERATMRTWAMPCPQIGRSVRDRRG
jgi:hypothetical protein